MSYEPDCIVYDSHARKGGENFLFFERGFRKLSLRELTLSFGRTNGGNKAVIACADTSDYSPSIDRYGEFFMPKAKVRMNIEYLNSDEYFDRKKVLDESYRRIRGANNEQT